MTTAESGNGRPDPSWTDPSSWTGAIGSAVRDDVDAVLEHLAGPREVTARLVDTPAPVADHDLDDVSVPAPPSPVDAEDPGFGRGVEPGAGSHPTGRGAADGGGGDDGARGDAHGSSRDDGSTSDHDGDGWSPHGTHDGSDDSHHGSHGSDHGSHGSDHGGGHDTDPGHDPDPGHDLAAGDHLG